MALALGYCRRGSFVRSPQLTRSLQSCAISPRQRETHHACPPSPAFSRGVCHGSPHFTSLSQRCELLLTLPPSPPLPFPSLPSQPLTSPSLPDTSATPHLLSICPRRPNIKAKQKSEHLGVERPTPPIAPLEKPRVHRGECFVNRLLDEEWEDVSVPKEGGANLNANANNPSRRTDGCEGECNQLKQED